MEVRERYISENPETGTVHAVQRNEVVPSRAQVAEAKTAKKEHAVWYVVTFLEVLVGLRFFLELLGARNAGFANFIYTLSEPLVAPFRGIFASPALAQGAIDPAALLAMIVVALIGWGIVGLIDLAGRPMHVASLR
jgi:uncharacterized protein YggT (Ycf19 family)